MIRASLFCAVFSLLRPSVAHLQGKTSGDSASRDKDVIQHCSGCHSIDTDETRVGPSLKGLSKRARLRNGKPATKANIRLVIKQGGDGMPAFERVLTSDELERLVAFLKRN
jgi:mono/diheme cytochrome c family protein